MNHPVYVHIGLGKTGTSTLQRALVEQRGPLAELGIDVPGERHLDIRRPVYDLMGRRIGGAGRDADARVTGAWAPFAASIAASTAPAVVFSEEMLALARPRVVRRLVDDLAPRRVVVVVTVRDLGRVLGSYWQQMLMMGRTETLPEFLEAVRDPGSGSASAGVGFWMRQDLVRTLTAWETAVSRADIRVVPLPAPGQPAELLNDRFAEVIGAPAGLLRGSRSTGNASVGVPEAEAIRRLNVAVGDGITEQRRLRLMRVIREGLVDRDSPRIEVPADQLGWIRERAEELVAELRSRGYPVVGSLDDLVPPVAPTRPVQAPLAPVPAEITEDDVAEAAIAALAAVAAEKIRRSRRQRRRRGRGNAPASPQRPATPSGTGWRSRARAASFRLRAGALERADRNRVLGWAARTYLRRTSGR